MSRPARRRWSPAAGSFAAIATLLGSPLLGAVLLMEAVGLGGTALELVLMPGLLAAGVGALVFTGLDAWTGLGTFSLKIPNVPHVGRPTISEFGWAIVIGLAAALLGTAIRRLALEIRPRVEPRMLLLTPVVGLAVGGLAVAYAEGSGRSHQRGAVLGPVGAARAGRARQHLHGGRCCCS